MQLKCRKTLKLHFSHYCMAQNVHQMAKLCIRLLAEKPKTHSCRLDCKFYGFLHAQCRFFATRGQFHPSIASGLMLFFRHDAIFVFAILKLFIIIATFQFNFCQKFLKFIFLQNCKSSRSSSNTSNRQQHFCKRQLTFAVAFLHTYGRPSYIAKKDTEMHLAQQKFQWFCEV